MFFTLQQLIIGADTMNDQRFTEFFRQTDLANKHLQLHSQVTRYGFIQPAFAYAQQFWIIPHSKDFLESRQTILPVNKPRVQAKRIKSRWLIGRLKFMGIKATNFVLVL